MPAGLPALGLPQRDRFFCRKLPRAFGRDPHQRAALLQTLRGELLHMADRFGRRRRGFEPGVVGDADGEAQGAQRFADFAKFGLAVRPVDARLGDMGRLLAGVANGGFSLDQRGGRREGLDPRLQRLAAALGLAQSLFAALQRHPGRGGSRRRNRRAAPRHP